MYLHLVWHDFFFLDFYIPREWFTNFQKVISKCSGRNWSQENVVITICKTRIIGARLFKIMSKQLKWWDQINYHSLWFSGSCFPTLYFSADKYLTLAPFLVCRWYAVCRSAFCSFRIWGDHTQIPQFFRSIQAEWQRPINAPLVNNQNLFHWLNAKETFSFLRYWLRR